MSIVTLASVAGLTRLFIDRAFLVYVMGAAVASHAGAAAARRRGLRPGPALAASAAAMVTVVVIVFELQTSGRGIPGPATLRAVGAALSEAWTRFGSVVAPTPATPGFVLAAVMAVWTGAAAADSFAFRVRTRFEALVPSFTVFLFGALLGADRYRVAVTVAYLAAVLTFLALTESASIGARAWRAAAVVGALAVVAAAVLGPRLPGAGDRELVAWRDQGGRAAADRVTVSPLVDIRGRLVDQSEVELFTVSSPAPAYWRLTALDRFDGTIWSSRAGYREARGELGSSGAVAATTTRVRQEFDITSLSSIWLPAAFRPVRVAGVSSGPDTSGAEPRPRVNFDAASASLVTSRASARGLRYSVDSAVPRLLPDPLASGASRPTPATVAEANLALPGGFAPDVSRLARDVVAGQIGPYHQARALQDWFRREFTYSLDVPPGHGTDAIRRFLFDTRTGYCEQFAGTFAAMARSLGIPTRVAVGFTPGISPADGRYRVRAKDAHAWPEVYLAGSGWVAFEPTPGRGMPGAEAYTGVRPPAAAGEEAADGQTTTPPEEAPAEADEPESAPATTVDTRAEAPGVAPQAPDAPAPAQRPDPTRWGVLLLLLTGALIVLAPSGVYLARRRRLRIRRTAATTPASQVLVAWEETASTLVAAGLGPHRWETPAEFARRAGESLGPAAQAMDDLAGAVAVATYRSGRLESSVVTGAHNSAVTITRQVATTVGPVRWFLWCIDPRPLWRERGRSRRHPAPDEAALSTPRG